MYCEQIHVTYDTENDTSALNAIMEFWTKITPGILQLLSQTKVVRLLFFYFYSLKFARRRILFWIKISLDRFIYKKYFHEKNDNNKNNSFFFISYK